MYNGVIGVASIIWPRVAFCWQVKKLVHENRLLRCGYSPVDVAPSVSGREAPKNDGVGCGRPARWSMVESSESRRQFTVWLQVTCSVAVVAHLSEECSNKYAIMLSFRPLKLYWIVSQWKFQRAMAVWCVMRKKNKEGKIVFFDRRRASLHVHCMHMSLMKTVQLTNWMHFPVTTGIVFFLIFTPLCLYCLHLVH